MSEEKGVTKLNDDRMGNIPMRVAVMQPYFFPYIGYFQLLASVDVFILFDNIQYTRKGWINRNRLLLRNGQDKMFSLPLKSAPKFQDICDRELAATFDRDKLVGQFREAYQRAPYFEQTFELIERVIRHEDANLFCYLYNSLIQTCKHLGIGTKIRLSSQIAIDHTLKSQEKVLALCESMGADVYVNSIGGVELYSRDLFRKNRIELKFLQSRPFEYAQFGAAFVPWLSIIDVMMFNSTDAIRTHITTQAMVLS
jgi:hypothetical protein